MFHEYVSVGGGGVGPSYLKRDTPLKVLPPSCMGSLAVMVTWVVSHVPQLSGNLAGMYFVSTLPLPYSLPFERHALLLGLARYS